MKTELDEMCAEDREAVMQMHETRDEFDDGPWFKLDLITVCLLLAFISMVVSVFRW